MGSSLITTPIFYVNGAPHIGHLYTCVFADAAARWKRAGGTRISLVTGTDEYGQKVEETAHRCHMQPHTFVDTCSERFRMLADVADVGYDDFLRTTEWRHRKAVETLWTQLLSTGLVFKGLHQGWYCDVEEVFLPPMQVERRNDGTRISVRGGYPLRWITEENYKFRLGAMTPRLKEWLRIHPHAISPPQRYNETWENLCGGLDDLAISRLRARSSWGIPVPNDPDQVIYVWIDALTNYLTVCGFPNTLGPWPRVHHIIGKDILRFHTIYWPALLMAVGLDPPERITVHGHWTIRGEKMSKSKGNVVDPFLLFERMGVDPTRYYLLREGPFVNDSDYSDDRVALRLNADLADTLGNLGSRALSVRLNPEGVLPACGPVEEDDRTLAEEWRRVPEQVDTLFRAMNFAQGLNVIFTQLRATNRYFTRAEPWVLCKTNPLRLGTVLFHTTEALRVAALLLAPIMPQSMQQLLFALGVEAPERTLNHAVFGSRAPGAPFGASRKGLILFRKV